MQTEWLLKKPSDQGLRCLPGPVCLKTSDHYDIDFLFTKLVVWISGQNLQHGAY